MSQANMTLENVARTLFRANLNDALAALASCQSGTSRPTGIPAGGFWVNTTTATAWVLNLFDGTDDIAIGTFNTTTNVFTPSIANNSLLPSKLALGAWTTVASAATVNLGAQTSRNIVLSGTTGITSFGSTPTPDNVPFNIRSTGAITITNSANLICPGGANLTLAAGDTFQVVQEATGVWRIIGFQFGTNPANAIPIGTAANNLVRLDGSARLPAVDGSQLTGVTKLIQGTAVSTTSGTAFDFTGIPSWVKRITVMFNGVSTSGTSLPMIQLGDAGGIEATGYTGDSAQIHTGAAGSALSTGFSINTNAATNVLYGQAIISYFGSNTWMFAFVGGTTGNPLVLVTGGAKILSDTLTQLRITTVNGTDTFDAGSINILIEG
jgi:hypothetical protein